MYLAISWVDIRGNTAKSSQRTFSLSPYTGPLAVVPKSRAQLDTLACLVGKVRAISIMLFHVDRVHLSKMAKQY